MRDILVDSEVLKDVGSGGIFRLDRGPGAKEYYRVREAVSVSGRAGIAVRCEYIDLAKVPVVKAE